MMKVVTVKIDFDVGVIVQGTLDMVNTVSE